MRVLGYIDGMNFYEASKDKRWYPAGWCNWTQTLARGLLPWCRYIGPLLHDSVHGKVSGAHTPAKTTFACDGKGCTSGDCVRGVSRTPASVSGMQVRAEMHVRVRQTFHRENDRRQHSCSPSGGHGGRLVRPCLLGLRRCRPPASGRCRNAQIASRAGRSITSARDRNGRRIHKTRGGLSGPINRSIPRPQEDETIP